MPRQFISSTYMQHPTTLEALEAGIGNKWLFVGLDLAPNDLLETGVAVLDRSCTLIRMDKLYSDASILDFIRNLGPANSLVVGIDMPKNLEIDGRWRQEEIRMHPLRLEGRMEHQEYTDRFTKRIGELYDAIEKTGAFVCLYLSYQIKMQYDLYIPYRSRTPQGCRALQSYLKTRLRIKNIPTNLAPSSVLDAITGAYATWTLFQGKEGQDFSLYQDDNQRAYMKGLSRVAPPTPVRRRRSSHHSH